MMLNQMPAGRSQQPEPQWTHYYPGSDFQDCKYRVEEREILGVKQKYIIIRGTILNNSVRGIDMPLGVNVYYPFANDGFGIEYAKTSGAIKFRPINITVGGVSNNTILLNSIFGVGGRFLIFARVK